MFGAKICDQGEQSSYERIAQAKESGLTKHMEVTYHWLCYGYKIELVRAVE